MKKFQATKNEALEKAAEEYYASPGKLTKEKVVETASALVFYYASIYSLGSTDEDLRQAGYEGLLKALKRFDPKHGALFVTYATHCIIGEIRHELRDRGSFKVPDWLKKLQAKIIKATEELAQKNGTMPTLKEIAQKVNVAEEGIVEAMQAGCVSLDEIDLTKVKSLRYESFKLPIEDVITVQMSLEKMDNLQRRVVTMVYYEGMTQEQVARKLGLNQRKVSRLLNSGLKEMRSYVMA